MTRDGADDHEIQVLAALELELRDQITRLTVDLAAERELRCAAVHALHDLTIGHHRLHDRYGRLCDEYRHLRAQIMRAAARAA